ncbi:MAG: phosphate/phosphite/phosphonate ABC transporter substrate-binding protein [Candidatus Entotheonellia bacterium]
MQTIWRVVHIVIGLACGGALFITNLWAADAVRFAVTDIVGLEGLQREFGAVRQVLSDATGLAFQFYPVSNRTAAVEALKSRKVDFVLTGPAEYVVFRKRTDAYPVVGFSRPDYFSTIIGLADSGISLPADLKGKKVAFGAIGSTSKHLAPMQLLKDYGVDPLKDIQPLHISENVAWEALKRGDIAALGTTYTIYLRLRSKEKALEPGAFRVIARGPDLPNDVLLAGPHVDKGIMEKVRQAFETHTRELIQAILLGEDNQKYAGMKFLTRIDDRDYNYVRAMYATIGYPEYAEFVEAK